TFGHGATPSMTPARPPGSIRSDPCGTRPERRRRPARFDRRAAAPSVRREASAYPGPPSSPCAGWRPPRPVGYNSRMHVRTLTDGGQTADEVAGLLGAFLDAAASSLDLAVYDLALSGEAADRVAGAIRSASAR